VALVLLLSEGSARAQDSWSSLGEGLDLGRFKAQEAATDGDSVITILRIDPAYWQLQLHSASESDGAVTMSAREWCGMFGMTAAINAGMFNTDRRAHTGYMKCGTHTNNASVNPYKSLAAFNPLRTDTPLFHIFDLDDTKIAAVQKDYACVIQNLRLIDRSRANRWAEQEKRWSEAALGEDKQGRILFIYSRSPYTMFDFNRILLALPVDLVCAQHLEGGQEAQFYVNSGGHEMELTGDGETLFSESGQSSQAWPVPNVLGIVKRRL
jgi:hypothetical protein